MRNPRESNQFLGKVARIPGWANDNTWVYDSLYFSGQPRKQRMVIPDRAELEKSGYSPTDSNKQPVATKSQWLTVGYFKFQGAMNAREEVAA
ncbi:MAG: hypothetical protein CGU28_16865 [Candidatus Dactylopiibacterium carminicum]|uniref:Uncharacterized protein n=1 Tax=Candidatus Dactylopiibacterium carminicum TaxID=857335 RepID=A0ABQ7HKQ6_9RHOO|nr:hypothetical protein [Candidatus Dactylopiibacterium carminicum]KAF7597750.1 hypothetical protein BGI27_17120 [Candidatus Dactylopiibacterium carminicum]PAS92231.1 MAG: hypothetical protein CGU28_16865 [Candidatus Dactylopiibacterium carminicum]PAS95021.1 MAG: hypothetical protein BSR46_17160 [Candidatus Dactylopiibacterium carminicum]